MNINCCGGTKKGEKSALREMLRTRFCCLSLLVVAVECIDGVEKAYRCVNEGVVIEYNV